LRTWAKEPLRAGHRAMTLRAKVSWEEVGILGFTWYVYIIRYIHAKSKKTPWLPPKALRSRSLLSFPPPPAPHVLLPANCWASSAAFCPAANFGTCLLSRIRDFINGFSLPS